MSQVVGPFIQQVNENNQKIQKWKATVVSEGRTYTLETSHSSRNERNAMLQQFIKDISNPNSGVSKVTEKLQPKQKMFVNYTFTQSFFSRKLTAMFEQNTFKPDKKTEHLEFSYEPSQQSIGTGPMSQTPRKASSGLVPMQRNPVTQDPTRPTPHQVPKTPPPPPPAKKPISMLRLLL